MSQKKKIGIMGGTFNPVHIVHLILAENAYRAYGLDEVMILPNGDPPHKTHNQIVPASVRMEMLEIAVKDIEYFRISDIEVTREGVCYSSDTLTYLNETYPENEYYFIMGADSIFQLETWHEPAEVMKRCIILAAVRDHVSIDELTGKINELKAKYNADIRILDIPDMELSSSELRNRVKNGASIRFMVPKGVDSYIESHGLYKEF